jgi:hypothetical protein
MRYISRVFQSGASRFRFRRPGASTRSGGERWFSYLALQRGWTAEETETKLLEVSEKARERARAGDAGYVHVTVENSEAWLERNRPWQGMKGGMPSPARMFADAPPSRYSLLPMN